MLREVTVGGKAYWLSTRFGGEVQVYEDCGGKVAGPWGRHHTTLSDGPLTVGLLTSRTLPAAVEALRGGSEERLAAVEAWRAEQDAEAHRVLAAAYPDVAGWTRVCGAYRPVGGAP